MIGTFNIPSSIIIRHLLVLKQRANAAYGAASIGHLATIHKKHTCSTVTLTQLPCTFRIGEFGCTALIFPLIFSRRRLNPTWDPAGFEATPLNPASKLHLSIAGYFPSLALTGGREMALLIVVETAGRGRRTYRGASTPKTLFPVLDSKCFILFPLSSARFQRTAGIAVRGL